MASTINATAHGFIANDPIYFSDLVGGAGIDEHALYYVIAAGLTADAFQFSETVGGASFTFTTAITDGQVDPWPTYVAETTGVMAPPPTPSTPSAPTVTSVLVTDAQGQVLVHLKVTP